MQSSLELDSFKNGFKSLIRLSKWKSLQLQALSIQGNQAGHYGLQTPICLPSPTHTQAFAMG